MMMAKMLNRLLKLKVAGPWLLTCFLSTSFTALGENNNVTPRHDSQNANAGSTSAAQPSSNGAAGSSTQGSGTAQNPQASATAGGASTIQQPNLIQNFRVRALQSALEIALQQKSPQVREELLNRIVQANVKDKTPAEAKAFVEGLPPNLVNEEEKKLLLAVIQTPISGNPPTLEELVAAARALKEPSGTRPNASPGAEQAGGKQDPAQALDAAKGQGKNDQAKNDSAKNDAKNGNGNGEQPRNPQDEARRRLEEQLADLQRQREALERAAGDARRQQNQNQNNNGAGSGATPSASNSGATPSDTGAQNQANDSANKNQGNTGKGLADALKNLGKKDKHDDLSSLFKGTEESEKNDGRGAKEEKKEQTPLIDLSSLKNKAEKEAKKEKPPENALPPSEGAAGNFGDPSAENPSLASAAVPVESGSFNVPEKIAGGGFSGAGAFDPGLAGGFNELSASDGGGAGGNAFGGATVTGGGSGGSAPGFSEGGGDPFGSVGASEPNYPPMKYNYVRSGNEAYVSGGGGNFGSAAENEDYDDEDTDGAYAPSAKPKIASVASQILGPRVQQGADGKRGIFSLIRPCSAESKTTISICDRIKNKKTTKSAQSGLFNLGAAIR